MVRKKFILTLSILLCTTVTRADEDNCKSYEDFIYFADHAAKCNEAVEMNGNGALTTNYSCMRIDGLRKRMDKNGHNGIDGMITGGEDAVKTCPKARFDVSNAAFHNMLTWESKRILAEQNK